MWFLEAIAYPIGILLGGLIGIFVVIPILEQEKTAGT
jgi:hypothetical protein